MFCMRHLVHARSTASLLLVLAPADSAARHASEALTGAPDDNAAIAGSAYQTRAGDDSICGKRADAIFNYRQAGQRASLIFESLVEIWLVNACVPDGKPRQSRALYDQIKPSNIGGLRQAAFFEGLPLRWGKPVPDEFWNAALVCGRRPAIAGFLRAQLE